MIVAFFSRLFLVYRILGEPSGCGSCLVISSATSDAPFLALWIAVTWFGFTSEFKLVSRVFRVISVASLVVYIADIYVMSEFFTRLYVTWVINIGASPAIIIDYLKSSGLLDLVAFVVLLGLIVASSLYEPNTHSFNRTTFLWLSVLIAASSIAAMKTQTEYVHSWATNNVFLTSQFSGLNKPYSDEYLIPLSKQFGEIPSCREGLDQRRDVIVLILESWSAYHSKAWGGNLDWTPELDRIAANSISFQKAVAGGFNTNQGLMSIISGIPILSPLTSLFVRKPFEPAWGWNYMLPKQLAEGGYETAFLTSGYLPFHGKADWIEYAGFDYVEGHDAAIYDGHPRGHFKAAPDEVLFQRAEEYWEERFSPKNPQAIVIESVSSHTPFVHPLTGEKSEESVIRYMDEVTGTFFHSLEKNGFFLNGGILLIVSDHRSMTVIRDEEKMLFGSWAPARIPMLIHGKDIKQSSVEKVVHQSDIAPSLAALLTKSGCGFPDWRNLFEENHEPKNNCVFHASGTDWEKLLVFCNKGHGVIKLSGEDSRFIASKNISVSERNDLLKRAAYFRSVAHDNNTRYLYPH